MRAQRYTNRLIGIDVVRFKVQHKPLYDNERNKVPGSKDRAEI